MKALKKHSSNNKLSIVTNNLEINPSLNDNEKTYAVAFRKLYYHLYSNSNSSRAERILSDLSNLLLCKIASERNGFSGKLNMFLNSDKSANDLLLPILKESYPRLFRGDEKFHLEDKTLRYGLNELSALSLKDASSHVMGEAFQALMGPRLRGDKGQFFTPKSLVKAMVMVINPLSSNKIVDPACGTGGFLVEAYNYCHKNHSSKSTNTKGILLGIDKDVDLCRLAEAMLAITTTHREEVVNANSLDIEYLKSLPNSENPFNADVVLTNPPFGSKIPIVDKSILRQFSFGHKWIKNSTVWHQTKEIKEAQDPQVLFIELCVRLLKPNGKLGIVLPEGIFGNSNTGFIWDYLRANGNILALLDCPRTTFQPSTDTKTNVLFFHKTEKMHSAVQGNKVWTAIALYCGHDRRGRNVKSSGESYPDDFIEIGKTYANRESGNTVWQNISISNPYYLCPRYYDKTPINDLKGEAKRLGADVTVLRDLVKKGYINIRKGNEVGTEAYGTGDIPFIRTSDISNYEVSIDSTRSISEEIYNIYREQQKLKPQDILLVCDGRYRIGRTAILHEYNYKCVVQSHIRILSVSQESPIDAIELLYILNLPMIQHQVRNLVFIQSTLGSLGKRINEIMIPIPKKNSEWKNTISGFRSLIEQRGKLLTQLHKFEHPGYDL